MDHFTPFDCNYPFVPPSDATESHLPPEEQQPQDEFDCRTGSVIECQNQTLGEALPITGTPLRLHYSSDRVPGYRSASTLQIPLSDASIPASLKRIELEVSVAGRRFTMDVPSPPPNLRTTFTWDGLDAYGRPLQGSQVAVIAIGYVYDGEYAEPGAGGRSFALASGTALGVSVARQEFTYRRTWARVIGAWDARADLRDDAVRAVAPAQDEELHHVGVELGNVQGHQLAGGQLRRASGKLPREATETPMIREGGKRI